MFTIKNNRLYHGGISFSLPDGFYLNTDVEEVPENNIQFRSQEKSFYIDLTFVTFEGTTEECTKYERDALIEADAFIYGENHPRIQQMEEASLYDLKGFSFMAFDNLKLYFEIAPERNLHLYIDIETEGDDIKEIMQMQEVQAFFKDIKIESEASDMN